MPGYESYSFGTVSGINRSKYQELCIIAVVLKIISFSRGAHALTRRPFCVISLPVDIYISFSSSRRGIQPLGRGMNRQCIKEARTARQHCEPHYFDDNGL
jgi:hypothetical protein